MSRKLEFAIARVPLDQTLVACQLIGGTMADIRPIAEEVASLCPPVGKALAYGRVYVFNIPGEGIKMVFSSDEKGSDGNPRLHTWLGWTPPAKARMGGRIDNLNGYYLIVAGGKKAAQRVADALNS